MEALIGFIEKNFRHPLVPLFFIFGAGLTLIGVTSGLPIEGYGELVASSEFRYVSILLGAVCLVGALFVYYKPPAAQGNGIAPSGNGDMTEIPNNFIPPELKLSWPAKRDFLTEKQRQLLSYVEDKSVSTFTSLSNAFADRPNPELYYRLEQLRLMGFIVCENHGCKDATADSVFYSISDSYLEEISYIRSNLTVRGK